MKKQTLIIALLAAAGFASTSVYAVDGTINITGEIVSNTCSVQTGSTNIAVALPKVSTSSLTTAGTVAGSQAFSIIVGTSGSDSGGCTNGTKIAAFFERSSPSINPITGNLINNAPGGATGIEVQLLDGSNSNLPINLSLGKASKEIVASGLTATLPFMAQYIATNSAVKAGKVSTSVQYTLTYP